MQRKSFQYYGLALSLICATLALSAEAQSPLRVHGTDAIGAKSAGAAMLRGPARMAMRETRLSIAASVSSPKHAAAAGIAEKSLRIGWARDVESEQLDGSAASPLQWTATADGGHVARASLVSPQAAALRLGLKARNLPPDAQLRFFSSIQPERIAGPVSGADVNKATALIGTYWSPITDGDTQVVEIWVPAVRNPAVIGLTFESASHLPELPSTALKSAGASQGCHEDVVCVAPGNAALARAARSVAKLVYTKSGATYMCTGTLINDGNNSQVPYMYTAAHCIDSQAVAATLNSYWSYEASQCGGKATMQWRQLSGGATLLYADTDSDVALLRLAEPAPDGAWFSGWDGTAVADGSAMIALHHPMGDVKKLALGDVHGDPNPLYLASTYRIGATEPGSSGSGLFTESGGEYLLRGGLRGGSSSCSNTGNMADPANRDYYSRLDAALPSLRKWFSAEPQPSQDFTGMWFDPAEPGWGIGIVQGLDNKAFVTWYTYDETTAARWFVMPEGHWRGAATLEGDLFRTAGTPYTASYDASRFSMQRAGSLRVEFAGNAATVTVVVDGRSISKPLVKLPL